MSGPIRTCVACRKRTDPAMMIRLVRHPSGVAVVDERQRLPGRGAWCHLTSACMRHLTERPATLSRAMRGPVDVGRVPDDVRAWLLRRIADGLTLARVARHAVVGHERILLAMAEQDVEVVAISNDISSRSLRFLKAKALPGISFIELPYASSELGALLGSDLFASVAILRNSATNNVCLRLRQWLALG